MSLTKQLSLPLRFLVKPMCCLMQIDLLALTDEEASSCQVTVSKALQHLQKTNKPELAFFPPLEQSTLCSMTWSLSIESKAAAWVWAEMV